MSILIMATALKSLNIQRPSITQVVYETLRDAIIDKSLAPGTKVSEVGLARMLNVSKTPVREALLRLRELHLIEEIDNKQLYVLMPSERTIASVFETRLILEVSLCSLAASRAKNSHLKIISEAADESAICADKNDYEGFKHWDRVFHTTIIESIDNYYLEYQAKNILLLCRTLRARDAPAVNNSQQCAREHRAIADAIIEQNKCKASNLMSTHINGITKNIMKGFVAKRSDN